MTKKALSYARVSTEEQVDGYSLPTQLEAIRAYCASHDLEVTLELQEDFSGTKLDRPQLARARELLRAGEAEAVVVFSPDRLTRNLAHSLILREEWQRAGVELHYCSRGRSENTGEGRMTENIEAVFAEYWREKIIEGSLRGRRGKAAANKWVGTGFVPFGYKAEGLGRDKHLVINTAEAAVVRRIYALYLGRGGGLARSSFKIAMLLDSEGVPTASTGRTARGWYDSTVKRILHSRVYIGEFHYGSAVAVIPELALVERATWEAVKARALANRKSSRRIYDYLLSGRATCACGSSLVGYSSRGEYTYYHCNRKTHLTYLPVCPELSLPSRKLDALVWDWLVTLLKDEQAVSVGLARMDERDGAALRPTVDRLAQIDDLVSRARRQIERLAEDLKELESDEGRATLRAQMDSLGKQIKALAEERVTHQALVDREALNRADRQLVQERAAAFREELELYPDFELKRFFFDQLDLKARLWRDDAGLRWLHVTCGLGEEELRIDGVLAACSDGRAGRKTNAKNGAYRRVILLEVNLPLDGQAAPTLADALFSAVRLPAIPDAR